MTPPMSSYPCHHCMSPACLGLQPLTFLPVMLYCGGPFVFTAAAMFCNAAGTFKENVQNVTQVRGWHVTLCYGSPVWVLIVLPELLLVLLLPERMPWHDELAISVTFPKSHKQKSSESCLSYEQCRSGTHLLLWPFWAASRQSPRNPVVHRGRTKCEEWLLLCTATDNDSTS